jgi:DNA transformation protein
MAISAAYLDMLGELLAPLGDIRVKRMFGGAGLYADGFIFALIDDETLYLKTDSSTRALFEAEGLGPFVYQGKTRPVEMSYWRAPDRLYDEPEEMLDWVRAAIVVARSQAAIKKQRAVKPESKSQRTKSATPRTAQSSRGARS